MKKYIISKIKNILGSKRLEKYHKYKLKKKREKDTQKAIDYLKKRDKIIDNIKSKPIKKILFFILNMDMWKYDKLLKLLIKDERFDVTIVSFDMPQLDKINSRIQQKRIASYCEDNGVKFIPGYDYENDTFNDLSTVHPDIISYTQPYNQGYEPWLIDSFIANSLFIYTPYGVSVTQGKHFYDTLLTNIAWKIFVGSNIEKDIINSDLSISSDNQVVTGYAITDILRNPILEKNPWKSNKKKVIWAPHHSLDNRYSFSSSNFERIYDKMIDIARKYSNQIEFAFKPHPILKERLIEKWGYEKTTAYYKKWQDMPNTFLCEGEYAPLFAYSDALIHDCASFVCEYLLTMKPALYITQDSSIPKSVNNKLGELCFNQHYHAKDIFEIEDFLSSVVIGGNDILKSEREVFVTKELLPSNGNTVGQNMMNELLKLIDK